MSTSEPFVVNVNESTETVEPLLEKKKLKKPFKVQYYRDEKSLQCNLLFQKIYQTEHVSSLI